MSPLCFHIVFVHCAAICQEVAVIPLLTLTSIDREVQFMDVFSLTIKSDASCEHKEPFSLKSKHKVNGQRKLIALWLSSLLSE